MAEPDTTTDAGEAIAFPFLDEVARPISAEAPGGTDVTYDEAFQQMKAEIDKLATAAADQVDFDQVIEAGRAILSRKAKDVRAAVFLTLALYRKQGLAGAAEGLAATRLLTETFWEDAFPPVRRMNARRNAYQMLSDRLKEWLADDKPTREEGPLVERALEEARALQQFCMETMEDQAPALSGLTRALEDVLRRVPKPAPSAQPAPSAPQKITPATATTKTPPAAPASAPEDTADVGEVRSPREARQVVLRLAAFIREKDARAPEAYALARVAQWGALDDLPHENGKTLVDPPPAVRVSFLRGLLPAGSYERLVREAEDSFREPPFHFWLDLQRLQATALEALGEPYRGVHETLLRHMAVLLHQVPGIERLAFKDGTPFADAMTQEWIQEAVRPLFGGGEGGGVTLRLGSAHLEEQYEAVRKQAGRGDLQSAVAAMLEGREHDTTAQDRFVRQLYVAELCVRGGKPAVARSMLEALDADVERHHLEAWEPALALRVWANLYRCYTQLGAEDDAAKADYERRARATFDKICRVDAGYALTAVGLE
ncbi:MAG: type VI secretion system protein TssA [Bacteroidetes bacterium]|nr:MAG: type VI secretion system protein TssA [Bacteroidota bacterium]